MTHEMKSEVNGFTRWLRLQPPFDKRHKDPNKNYGIGGMTLCCTLTKNKRAVCFIAYLPVYLPHVANELWRKRGSSHNSFTGMGADVGYHSPTPMYEGQTPMRDDCIYIGCKCYYEGSSLAAQEWYEVFLREGIDAIWSKLELLWKDYFRKEQEDDRS